MIMSGVYLPASWTAAGSFMGVSGGMMMGSSSYFLVKRDGKQGRQ
ncbi:hypothetical protein [Cytobacillus sp. NCCP-133]|nr:hypothetical protein [Cytobacillus sp. NCCP-133]GLB61671.1 hypothetical protein NCCP133_38000 [Cytobacillus sp. NCCP-133]